MHDAASNLTALDTTLCEGDSQPVCVFTLTVEAQRVHDDDREVHSVLTVDPDASDRIYMWFFLQTCQMAVFCSRVRWDYVCVYSLGTPATQSRRRTSLRPV